MKSIITALFIAVGILASNTTFAQAEIETSPYEKLVQEEIIRISQERAIPSEYKISSVSSSERTGRSIVYVQHTAAGVPIKNAISIMAFDKSEALQYERISSKVADFATVYAPSFKLSPERAKAEALHFAGIEEAEVMRKAPKFIKQPISVQKVYLPEDGRLHPVYEIEIYIDYDRTDVITIDASSSEVLKSYNKVLECVSIVPSVSGATGMGLTQELGVLDTLEYAYQYNVAPIPDINVIEKGRRLIDNPADEIASEIGWHNVKGILDGPENILEGNNVLVNIDRMGNWTKDDTVFSDSTGKFDFPLDLSKEPGHYVEASMTQLFVVNNQIHDILYHNYFDEEAGNFQQMNFQSNSLDNDPVIVFGQSGAGNPDGGRNNALFYPSPDGSPGYMLMFVWGFDSEAGLNVIEPESIAGEYMIGGAAFTPSLSDVLVEGRVVIADNGDNSDACTDFLNEEEIVGNIVIIDRGNCNFDEKVQRAEAAGAIAVIIINQEGDELIQMGGTVQASIPAVMVGRTDGNLFKQHIEELYVTLGADESEDPKYRDGALDNTVPIHEYGHGVSTRLVGGPAVVDCLQNDEQMGEGWSDILAILMTMNEENYHIEDRVMGSYAFNNALNEGGIRRKVYSPDFAVNSYTYKDAYFAGSGPHNLGEIWATFLWDLTRALVDLEGFDEDLMYGNGGNRTALQLIVEGLKYTECDPGMVDGRDGILAADEALFGGKYSCLIWEVFARRGLGYYADQVNSRNRKEGVEDFHLNPYCDPSVKISKAVTEFVAPGDTVEVVLQVLNHSASTAHEILVEDMLPEGAEFIKSEGGLSLDNMLLSVVVDQLEMNDTATFSYSYIVDRTASSESIWRHEFETSDSLDMYYTGTSLSGGASTIRWEGGSGKDNSASIVFNGINNSDQVLALNEAIEVDVDKPMLIVEHAGNIRMYDSGAFFEYSIDGEEWDIIDSALVTGKYNYKMRGGDIPDHYQYGFSGENDWTRTVIDLEGWRNMPVYIRMRLSTNIFGREEWKINEVSYWDRLSYNTEACVQVSETRKCTTAAGYGTIVIGELQEDTTTVSTVELESSDILIQPQPFAESFRVSISEQIKNSVESIYFYNAEGQIIKRIEDKRMIPSEIDAREWTPGLYFMQINAGDKRYSKKLLKD